MKNIYQKRLALQKELKSITKNKINPFCKSSYADINSIIKEITPFINKLGLLLQQSIQYEIVPQSTMVVDYILTQLIDVETNEKISSKTRLIISKQDSQAFGSAITYNRRYSIITLLGLEQVDDDGILASNSPPSTLKKYSKVNNISTNNFEIISSKQLKYMKSLLQQKKNDSLEKNILEKYSITHLKYLRKKDATKIIDYLVKNSQENQNA